LGVHQRRNFGTSKRKKKQAKGRENAAMPRNWQRGNWELRANGPGSRTRENSLKGSVKARASVAGKNCLCTRDSGAPPRRGIEKRRDLTREHVKTNCGH